MKQRYFFSFNPVPGGGYFMYLPRSLSLLAETLHMSKFVEFFKFIQYLSLDEDIGGNNADVRKMSKKSVFFFLRISIAVNLSKFIITSPILFETKEDIR